MTITPDELAASQRLEENMGEIDRSLFHQLWTRAVGAPDYVKSDWMGLDSAVTRVNFALREARAFLPKLREAYEAQAKELAQLRASIHVNDNEAQRRALLR